MKFVLTGCTGFIGGEVLAQCLRNPAITSIIALSRRNLPDAVTKDPKLQVVVMEDFNSYPDSVLKGLSGANACIWCFPIFRPCRNVLQLLTEQVHGNHCRGQSFRV